MLVAFLIALVFLAADFFGLTAFLVGFLAAFLAGFLAALLAGDGACLAGDEEAATAALGFLAAGFLEADLALGALDLLAGLLEGDLDAFLAILIIIPKWIMGFHL